MCTTLYITWVYIYMYNWYVHNVVLIRYIMYCTCTCAYVYIHMYVTRYGKMRVVLQKPFLSKQRQKSKRCLLACMRIDLGFFTFWHFGIKLK